MVCFFTVANIKRWCRNTICIVYMQMTDTRVFVYVSTAMFVAYDVLFFELHIRPIAYNRSRTERIRVHVRDWTEGQLFQGENGRVRSYLVRNANEAEKQEKLCKNRVCLFSALPYLVEKLITREHVNRRKISSECLL